MKLRFSGWLGAFLVVATVLVALVSLVWTPYDPTLAHPDVRLAGPSAEHLLGTDRFGRDTASRIMAGAQITVFVGLVAVGIAALVGVPLGILAGMRRGRWADALVMRGADLLLAFPALLLAIIAGAVWGPSTLTAMVAIGIAGIPSFARVARSGTLQVITRDFFLRAHFRGAGMEGGAAPYPAQYCGPAHRAGLRLLRPRHPGRGRPFLPRPGHRPAGSLLGPHAARFPVAAGHRSPAGLLAWPCHCCHGAGL